MDTTRRERIEALFEEALERSPEERGEWLDAACAADDALRADVDALLAAHAYAERLDERHGAWSPLQPPRRAAAQQPEHAARPQAGQPAQRRIGAYRVIRELGRGGMGVVYLAERDDGQYRRRVAIKLLRGSPDADELQRRFRAERQILASLAHPNIAQLLDGGITDGQLPYLVMEYVEGLPITTYCDRHRLRIDERLRLFQEVCAAVHHAHTNLVIHRDLKPGNILVTATGQVKLLDFGIAKLLNPGLGAADAPMTHTNFRMLTPEYASPEQIRGETLTTASDVYALGVILYELLAGRPPYRLTSHSPRELAELIEEREPQRPSSRLLEEAEATAAAGGGAVPARSATAIAEARDVSVDALRRSLRGDLDAIAMRALRKESSRRYASADRLASDVQRYFDGLPVLAHRGSRWYRLGKAMRRHRVAAVAAALVAVSLAGGAAAAAWQAAIARHERDRAEQALQEAEHAHRESEIVAAFLMNLFEAGDPLESLDQGVTARDLLRRGTARMDQLSSEPLTQAKLLEVVGRVYRSIGEYASARAAFERALAARRSLLGDEHMLVSTTMHQLADAMRLQGNYAEAMDLARSALAIRERIAGDDWPDVAEHIAQVAGMYVYFGDLHRADTLMLQSLDRRVRQIGREDTLVAASLERVGAVKRRLGRNDESERYLREAIDLRVRLSGERGAALNTLLLRLGDILVTQDGRLEGADSAYGRALAIARTSFEPTHHLVLQAEGVYASFRSLRGFHEQAEAEWRRLLDTRRRVYGPDHLWTIGARAALAGVLLRAGKYAEAEQLLQHVIEQTQARVGPQHSLLTGHYTALSEALAAQHRYDEAERAAEEAIRVRRLGFNTAVVGLTITYLADVKRLRGDYATAESLFLEGLALMKDQVAPAHHDMRRIHSLMSSMYEAWGRPAEAEQYRRLAAVQ